MFKTLNRIGFFKTVLDDAGFRQILSTSSAHMTVLREGTETAEAVSLSSQAVQSLNSRISDPTLCTSDGVMSTILAFACHSVSEAPLNNPSRVSKASKRITTRGTGYVQ